MGAGSGNRAELGDIGWSIEILYYPFSLFLDVKSNLTDYQS